MRTLNLFRQLPVWLLGAALCMGGVATSYAVDDVGLFQLDGNPLDDNALGTLSDDWETLCDPVGGAGDGCNNAGPGPGPNGSAVVFTGIKNDPNDTSIFTGGGSKDKLDITSWLHKNGSVSQKSDITNAYAAAYTVPAGAGDGVNEEDDLIIYFGADRLDNEGSTFMGFWFFQNNIKLNPLSPMTGSFDGEHKNGDFLVLANFPQANNAVPLIQVLAWDTKCTKKDSVTPMPGQCAETNLRLVLGESGAGAICTQGGLPQLACAITNTEGGANDPVDSPWPYVSADGDINSFPFESFFSGGINVSKLIPGTTGCFSSFMAETRSAESISASLEDFSLDEFQLCGASAVTEIFNVTQNKVIPIEEPLNDDSVVGDSIRDKVTIIGTALGSSTSPDPASPPDVTFVLFDNGTCTPEFDVDGDGFPNDLLTDAKVLDDSTVPLLVDGFPIDGTATASSDIFVLTQTGAHSYRAFWAGDENYPGGAISACEPFSVIQPKLTIQKEIDSCGVDAGEFAVSVVDVNDVVVMSATLGDGETEGPNGLAPGTYTVSEVVQDAYVAFYDATLTECVAGASGDVQSITLAGNADKTCTFLNVRKPQVTVIKQFVGGAAGTFDLRVAGIKVNTLDVPLQGSTLIHTLVGSSSNNFGTPTVSEVATGTTNLANYSTIIQCDDGTSAAWDKDESTTERSVTLDTALLPGDHVTCTITNISPVGAKACLNPLTP